MRREMNTMTKREYLAGWLYWTGGFGDNLARKFLDPRDVARFDEDRVESFYLTGARRFGDDVEEAVRAGLRPVVAERRAVRGIVAEMLGDPMYYATVPLLVWRGLWMDRLAFIGGPLLIVALLGAYRRRDGPVLAVLSLGVYSLLFHAAASQSFTRFQFPAMPALCIGSAWAASLIWNRFRPARVRRDSASSSP
jgi:hypothetical protein